MVKSKFDEGLGTLDVTVVVTHNDQIIIVLLGPVVIELDRVLGQRVIHEDLLNLLLQLLGGGPVQVVGEPDILSIISQMIGQQYIVIDKPLIGSYLPASRLTTYSSPRVLFLASQKISCLTMVHLPAFTRLVRFCSKRPNSVDCSAWAVFCDQIITPSGRRILRV